MFFDLFVIVYLQEASHTDLESESEVSLPEVAVGLSKMMQTDTPLAGTKLLPQEPSLVRMYGIGKPGCTCAMWPNKYVLTCALLR